MSRVEAVGVWLRVLEVEKLGQPDQTLRQKTSTRLLDTRGRFRHSLQSYPDDKRHEGRHYVGVRRGRRADSRWPADILKPSLAGTLFVASESEGLLESEL